jgi:hypothetical protein
MPRFLIEVPHDATLQACVQAIDLFHKTGSHFLTHADWGCIDGDHKAWITVELENREQARGIIPPQYRASAKIVQLNAFSRADLDKMLKKHDP